MMWLVGVCLEWWCAAFHRLSWKTQHGYDGQVVHCPICGDSWDDSE